MLIKLQNIICLKYKNNVFVFVFVNKYKKHKNDIVVFMLFSFVEKTKWSTAPFCFLNKYKKQTIRCSDLSVFFICFSFVILFIHSFIIEFAICVICIFCCFDNIIWTVIRFHFRFCFIVDSCIDHIIRCSRQFFM